MGLVMPNPLGDFTYTWPYLAAAVLGYLLGSVPFGLILTRLAGKGDIRQIGSGNIGATNVLRTGSKLLAGLTLLADGGKGAVAVGLAGLLGPDMAVLAGGGALLGHCFPVWLKFKGGKGVATFLGILLAIAWPVGIVCCLAWLAVAAITRYSSAASLAAALLAPLAAYWLADFQRMELALVMSVIVFARHYQNIARLIRREESKIGEERRASDAG